jgi:hypothetical protein
MAAMTKAAVARMVSMARSPDSDVQSLFRAFVL